VVGVDVFDPALQVARPEVEAAGLGDRVRLERRSIADPGVTPIVAVDRSAQATELKRKVDALRAALVGGGTMPVDAAARRPPLI
jgi:hypothetical protein